MTNQSHTELAAHMALVSEYAKACNNAMSAGTVKFAEVAWLAVEASARNLAALESPERVPLSDEQIDAIPFRALDIGAVASFREFARAIEAHHGIVTKEST